MVFIVIDFTCFYIFFESILPPLFLLIGVYGAAQRFRAGYYLFLYTLFGSLFMLVSFMKMGGEVASTFFDSIPLEDLYQILETIL
jgi:NADH-ubiquinone oxidoreductase chain 4